MYSRWLMLLVLAALPLTVFALPRFSASYEQSCFLCHVSPSGGGLRNGYGTQFFAAKELSVRSWSEEELDKYQPKIAPGVTIGADLRTLFAADDSTHSNTNLQMEGDLSVALQPVDGMTILVQQGLSGVSSVYALQNFKWLHSYVKVGRFRPDFGWMVDDHTQFTRAPLRWQERYFDTGVEVGLNPERLQMSLGIYNGTGTAQTDNNPQKAVLVSVRYRPQWFEPVKVGVGFSGYRTVERLPVPGNLKGVLTIAGPHYSVNYAAVTLIGETDWKLARADSGGSKLDGLFSANTLYIDLRQGITATLGYEFMDRDTHLKSGATTRYSVGMQFFPTPFTELSPQLRVTKTESATGDKKVSTGFAMNVHFFY